MDPISRVVAAGAAGAGGAAAALYVDDVFSTYLYDGTGATQTITNGIDLSGEGGLVWIKLRDTAKDHGIFDTERGAGNRLESNTSNASDSDSVSLTTFNSDGFSLGIDNNNEAVNVSGGDYASWTFRKAPGFFDVVTYTGNGVEGRDIAHSLGSVPGMMVVKNLDTTDTWRIYHRELTADETLRFGSTAGAATTTGSNTFWNGTRPTASVFTVGQQGGVNASGNNYVCYLFAHDDQSFGTNSDEAIIKCGSYTGNGSSSGPVVNLGFEPQWILTKRTSGTSDWYLFDTMRGLPVGSDPRILSANQNTSEIDGTSRGIDITPTGFQVTGTFGSVNGNGETYAFIAIRRPHKPPSTGTDVLDIIARSGTGSTTVVSGDIEPVDFVITKSRNTTNAPVALTRMLGNYGLQTNTTTTANTNVLGTSITPWDIQDGITFTGDGDTNASGGFNYINYFFKRAAGFFDVVTYTGTGSSTGVNHNLGVIPELKIIKNRDSSSGEWIVGGTAVAGENGYILLNSNADEEAHSGYWDGGDDSATQFSVRQGNASSDNSGNDYIAYLFASLSNVSKIGSYSGTGNAINVDCGFTAGARFVLIKRTDSTGDWYVWDSTRGIVSSDDPYLELNTSDTEVTNTDYIDPLAAGFTVTSSAPAALNTSGGTYLFLAIA